MQKLLTFFQQKILMYLPYFKMEISAKNINVFAIFQDGNFNVTLANKFVKF